MNKWRKHLYNEIKCKWRGYPLHLHSTLYLSIIQNNHFIFTYLLELDTIDITKKDAYDRTASDLIKYYNRDEWIDEIKRIENKLKENI